LFEDYSEQVLSKVRELVFPDDPSLQQKIKDERFELKISLLVEDSNEQRIPANLVIKHDTALTKFLQRPAILKIFRSNLKLSIDALEDLDNEDDPQAIADAITLVLG
jgi:hypothetical protein